MARVTGLLGVVPLAAALLLSVVPPARADGGGFTAKEDILRGLALSYRLRFKEAKGVFERVAVSHPGSPAGQFYSAAIGWGMTESDLRWRYLAMRYTASEPPKKEVRDYEALARDLKAVIDRCGKTLETRPDDFEAMFYTAGSYGFLARMEAYRSDYFSAMYNGKKSTEWFERLLARYPERGDALIGPAIYKYHVGRMPAPFRWVIAALGLSGTKEEGAALAERAYHTAELSRMEAADFLSRMRWLWEKDYKEALRWADAVDGLVPGTPAADLNRLFISRLSGNLGGESGAARGLMAALDGVDPEVRDLWRPLVLFIAGDISDRQGDPKGAVAFYRQAVESPGVDPWLAGYLKTRFGPRLKGGK